MTRRLLALTLFAIVALAARNAAASPFDTFGTGARAVAMGGAYSAVGGDSAAMYYNLGSLTRARAFQIELGYHRAEMEMTINDRQTDIDPDRGVSFGLIVGKNFFGRRWRIGALVFTPDDHFLRLIMPPRYASTFIRYNNDNHIQGMIIGMAYEVTKWWSIGAGATFVSGNSGGVDFFLSDDTPAEGDLRSKVGSDVVPVAGMLFTPHEKWRIGVSFREEQNMELVLKNTIHMEQLEVLPRSGVVVFHDGRLLLTITSHTHFSPRQYQGGVSFEPNDRLVFAVDATYYEWSNMKSNVSFSQSEMQGDFGVVFPTTPEEKPDDPGLHDVVGLALGAEGTAVRTGKFELDLRGGYNLRPTPVPNQNGVTNNIDSTTHVLSAGIGFTFMNFSEVFPAPISFDIYDQYHQMEQRTMKKDDPTNVVGDYRVKGRANNIGAQFTLRF
ncbi:outer membrane protein transport protein [bacterium]|nr:outer membrane protein transport protein [bacterium]